jgi:(Z)-2-((N-methylformamido)methylene)-5-hydroxybutyrolactone dehydrogenase
MFTLSHYPLLVTFEDADVTVTSAKDLVDYPMLVGGRHVGAFSGAWFHSVEPGTGVPWARVPDGDERDVDEAVDAARRAFTTTWGRISGFERARVLRRAGDLVESNLERLAEVEARDSGRLLRDSLAQVQYVAEWLHYFAGYADKIEGQVIPVDRDDMLVYTQPVPAGVVGAIIPWNAPLLLLAWKLAPALAAGCTLVVKPSEHTPVSALVLGDVLTEAGLPDGTYNVVTGDGPTVPRALAAHPGVDKIAFTGSTNTGIAVGRAALGNLTRLTLELGGKSAQVVFDDADMDLTVSGVLNGIFVGAGQTCMAGGRLLVHESVHDELVNELTERTRAIRLGPPTDEATDMGPLITADQQAGVLTFINTALSQGAVAVCGGGKPADREGLFIEPTILTGVHPDMEIVQQEVFGPVLVVMPFRTEEEAVALANGTDFGLAAGVWSRNVHRAHRVAQQLRAGTVWVNTYRMFSPGAPFGGFGLSGLGRENGAEAIRAYTETRTIWVELAGAPRNTFSVR